MSTHSFTIAVLAAGLALMLCGCGSDTDVCRVSGRVTYAGQPVKAGMVYFEPAAGQSQSYGIPIRDGRYESTQKTTIKPGSYIVRITAPDLSKSQPNPNAGPNDRVPPSIPLLPPAWNNRSKLVVELKAGKNTANFSGEKMGMPMVEVPEEE